MMVVGDVRMMRNVVYNLHRLWYAVHRIENGLSRTKLISINKQLH